MNKPEFCKICKETELEFHESTKIYNPENDEKEEIKNVYECNNCGAYHFELGEYECVQTQKSSLEREYMPNITPTVA